MKLTTFDTELLPPNKRTAHKPLIGLSIKAGTFRINAKAVELMKLKKNMRIKFHFSDDTDEWFLEVTKEESGFLLREKENITPGGLIFQSTALVKQFFSSVSYTKNSGHLQVGSEAVKYEGRTLWPLITGLLQN